MLTSKFLLIITV